MSENSVKDILAKFNQGNGPPVGLRPVVHSKPSKAAKPDNLALNKDHSSSNGAKSPSGGSNKPLVKPPGAVAAFNVNQITSVKLRKPPLPKTPPEKRLSEVEVPEWMQPKTKPKPPTPMRKDSSTSPPSPSSLPSHSHLKSPSFVSSPAPIESSLHPKTAPKQPPTGKKPKPPPPSRKDSITKPGVPAVSEKPSFPRSVPVPFNDNKENWKNGVAEDEPPPPISDSENSSASSVTDFNKRSSFLHSAKSGVQPGKPMLLPLPPLSLIGNAPRKPVKPPSISLSRFKPTTASSPLLPPKPGPQSSAAPALPARPSAAKGSRAKPSPPVPVPEEEAVDSGEIYDDVEGGNPPVVVREPRRKSRPFSLIETMDSDEEDIEGADEIYDDTEQTPGPPSIPAHPTPTGPPSLPPHPTLTVTSASGDAPPLPSISSIPALHGSGGSSITVPRSAENSGSGLEEQEIYDDVSAGEDQDELYEALDIDEGVADAEMAQENEQEKKQQEEKRKKEDERLKKEQEKQQKKEEEKRKKKEKEDKKKKEKEEKDVKKKFNIKGDISIIDEGIVMEAMDAVYEKLDLQCKIGEKIEILRKEGNPPGKWLARNPGGHYGYVDHQFVRLEIGSGGDFGDVYDDVIGGDEDDSDNIYDAVT